MENPENVKKPDKPDKFQFKEPIVLSSMICLMLLCGIYFGVDMQLLSNSSFFYTWYENYSMTLPVIGILLITILSEYKGRKPALITLAAASVLSTILHIIPNQEICGMAGYILQGVVRGGIFSTTFLAISEFCSPKHRFAYLIANMAAFTVGLELTSLLNYIFMITIEKVYAMLFVLVVLEVVCLAVVSVGPESPYWLARRGRVEESRWALLWLRGEGSEAELRSILQQPHRRGPLRLFWLPLLAGISAVSIAILSRGLICVSMVCFDTFEQYYTLSSNESIPYYVFGTVNLVSIIIFLPIIIILSYKVNRKSLFLAISVIPLALSYTFAVWLYFPSDNEYYRLIFKYLLLICRVAVFSGPYLVGIVSCAEIIPPKYNTYIICLCFVYYYPMHMFSCDPYNLSSLPLYGLAILNTTLALFCVIVFYFLSPETKNKMLLETQELYMPKQRY